MKGKELEIGSRVWEEFGTSEPYSAGRVVAMSDSVERSDVVYVLLKSDEGAFTIYSMDRNYNCNPRLTRKIPAENFEDLVRAGLSGVELPEESEFRQPKKKKAPQDGPISTMEIPEHPEIQLSDEPAGMKFFKEACGTVVDVDGKDVEFEKIIMGFDVTMKVV